MVKSQEVQESPVETSRAHKISVNEMDIADAVPKNSHRCMIATAIQRHIPNARHIDVDTGTIRYSDPTTGLRYVWPTPAPAQVALLAFDAGRKVEPFTLRLQRGFSHKMRAHRLDPRKNARSIEAKRRSRQRGTKKVYMPSPQREFGMRVLVER